MYYSDKIEDTDNKRWIENKDYVYLDGDTGTGKSTYIFEKLIPYIYENTDKSIFLLSNRKLLCRQHRNTARKYGIKVYSFEKNGYCKQSRLQIMTYQYLHKKLKENEDFEINLICDVYNTVFILDECHYFLSDQWNKTTEKTLDSILQTKAPTFFISATGDNVVNYVNQVSNKKITKQNTVSIPQNYSNITLKSIYDKGKQKCQITDLIYDILDNTSDKVIYYHNNINRLCDIADELKIIYDPENIKLCYSPYDKDKHSLPSERDNILTDDNRINGRCILTTKIIDNGIDIFDDALKHVIIDLTEPETIIQAIGRKRTKTPLTVYINEPHKTLLYTIIETNNNKLKSSKSTLNKYQYNVMIRDIQLFIDNSIISVIYEKLKHTGIQLDKSNKHEQLLKDLENYAVNHIPVNKDNLKSLLSDTGIKAKQIDKINAALKDNNIPYVLCNKRERINGSNSINVWYVSDV